MSAPVGNTRPDINKAQKKLHSCIKDAEYAVRRYEMSPDALSILEDTISEMAMAIDTLEDMRASNSKLREWGEEMENEVEALNKYVKELEEQIPIPA